MFEVASIFRVSVGVLIAMLVALFVVYWFVRDITQKRHTVLRNFPVIGHLRFFFENLGEYFRQYLFLNDREEMPFNRATRAWVYRLAKTKAAFSVSARLTNCRSQARWSSSMPPSRSSTASSSQRRR